MKRFVIHLSLPGQCRHYILVAFKRKKVLATTAAFVISRYFIYKLMPMTAGRNLFLRQAEWGSDCCLLERELWNTNVASANKRSDIEREQFLYNCNFRLCMASGLTHRSFLNGVKLPTVGKLVTGEKATAVYLGSCSRILWLWLLLPCRCYLHSFAHISMPSIWSKFLSHFNFSVICLPCFY